MIFKTSTSPLLTIFKTIGSLILLFIPYITLYCICLTNEDKVIKEDKNNIYVMVYSILNKDSSIVKYHKPIIVEAKILYHEKFNNVLRLKNIKNGQEFNINDEDVYQELTKPHNIKKIHKFKYTYYPVSKIGYTYVK